MIKRKTLIFILMFLSAHPALAKIKKKTVIYGASKKKNKLSASVFYQNNIKHTQLIIITGGVHGHEYTGLVDKIGQYFNKAELTSGFKNYFDNGGVFLVVPKVNIDAVMAQSRFDSEGYDINRSFKKKIDKHYLASRSLSKFVDSFLKSTGLKLKMAVDYHCCGKALLKANGDIENEGFYRNIELVAKSQLDQGYSVTETAKLFGKKFKGTLKDYWHRKYQIPSFTLELSSMAEGIKLFSHLGFWDSVADYIISSQPPSRLIATNIINTSSLIDQFSISDFYSE